MNILITTSSFGVEDFGEYTAVKNPHGRKLTEAESIELYEKYKPAGIIAGVEPLTKRVLESAKANGVKVISRCGTGTDTVDLAAAEQLGIPVKITPNAPVVSVAELTLSLIMALSRNIVSLNNSVKSGGWKGAAGNLVSGKTVGIIGGGRIGTHLAKILNVMGCALLCCDPFLQKHAYCKMVDLDTLARQSDLISLHVPYTAENHHLINKEVISKMKETALFINCARGGLVDEDALYDALKEGCLAGAALDCFEQEPYTGKLTALENVIITPHVGSSAKEGRVLMETEAKDNLLEALKNVI